MSSAFLSKMRNNSQKAFFLRSVRGLFIDNDHQQERWRERRSSSWKTGAVLEFICLDKDRQSGFEERLSRDYSIFFLLLPDNSMTMVVIDTATFLHGNEWDEYINKRYAD